MALTLPQQVQHLLQERKRILITFQKNQTGGDAIGSAVALALFLEKMGKQVDIISSGFVLPRGLQFLERAKKISDTSLHLQKFIVSVDVEKSGVQELSYDVKDGNLRIFVTPKKGTLHKDNVRTAQTEFAYDLIIIVDTQDLESLGVLYRDNIDLFYKTPIINIDHHVANEHFGQVNILDHTAASTAEVMFDLMKKISDEYIDKTIATALLTGIIAKTRSFKTDGMRPQTLTSASRLVAIGAEREQIVHELYRTRGLSTLKLWGQALNHLEYNRPLKLVWSTLTRDDFIRSGADAHELPEIIDELISTSPDAAVTLLCYESIEPGITGTFCILYANRPYNARDLASPFSPHGHERLVTITSPLPLKQFEQTVVEHLMEEIKKHPV